jgi:hypothetical protein
MQVKLTYGPNDPVIRQTPGSKGVWGPATFHINDLSDACDYWMVIERTRRQIETVYCKSGHVIFAPLEPPEIRSYHPGFLAQFTKVLHFRDDIQHNGNMLLHPIMPWWMGIKGGHHQKQAARTYDDLCKPIPAKQKLISVICSDKIMTPGHVARLGFVKKLKEHFGEKLDVFGFGSNVLEDKWDGIAPYKYHITIENTRHPDYWTEKVADTFLGGAFMIYDGCPNLERYFPEESFCMVDRYDPAAAIAKIEALIKSEAYGASAEAIEKSRRLVLEKYNLFPAVVAKFEEIESLPPCKKVIRSEYYFRRNVFGKVRSRVREVVLGR